MDILTAKGLVKYYGKGESLVKAVDHTSFSVEKGEFTAIVGTSGSGKTTLLNLIGGLDRPDEGKIIIDGQDISGMKPDELTIFRRRKIGFIFQNYNLVSVLNVYKNIVMPVKLDGNKADTAYIKRITKMLGIEHKMKSYPNQLSGGQQQRVAIARALSAKPAIILADEPTRMSGDREAQAVYDRRWTEEALFNILDNAVKYGEPGMPVCVTVTSYELFVRIDIMNYGNEIPGEEYPRIFMRYYRGGNAVFVKEGIGLGLYLFREIITDQGGYIKVSSAKGMGNVFSVFLKKR
ncbi:MAG TPA: ATP-binding cassette domain-containing protein [Candidatus Mediterraneibacter caccavium]|uniref:histidine kinase n=1 Tax=Candidatus Mediterraneibacter caccavium TaxID=2838661 RepID=A0A9D2AT75_9FIRM|nr:ATP-binding cassette domain-containing protein [Candidatus Mediterraneibacter caccavium]